MTPERYQQFLESELGRSLPEGPVREVPMEVHDLLAWLAKEATDRKRQGQPVDDVCELIDLIAYRLYGFTPEDVEKAERYINAHGDIRMVEDVFSFGRLA